MIIQVKPMSVNQVWQGRRFKTKKYKDYEKYMLSLLPQVEVDFKKQLCVELTFGFSSVSADIDNPIKPILDILQKKYNFNDKQIYELNVKKEIVKKGNEFIKLKINEL